MTTATFDSDGFLPLQGSMRRSAAALRSLMRDWEQEATADEDESETELMVLLSGMVSLDVPTLSDA
jgi:hypothetical protein